MPAWRAAKATIIVHQRCPRPANPGRGKTFWSSEGRIRRPSTDPFATRIRATPRDRPAVSGSAMTDLISLTPDNVDAALSDLPRLVRMAIGYGSRLRRGTLDVTLPDGRTVRLGGVEPGPAAAMTVY